MIPMKVYFFNNMLKDFKIWYESNPELPEIEALSTNNVSELISVTDGFLYDDITPQVVINSKPEIIQLLDQFLLEQNIVGTKEKFELRINLK